MIHHYFFPKIHNSLYDRCADWTNGCQLARSVNIFYQNTMLKNNKKLLKIDVMGSN